MKIYYQRHCANLVSWGNSNEKEYLNSKTALGQTLPLNRWVGVLVILVPSTVCLSKGLTFIWQRCGWPGCATGRSREGSHNLLKTNSQISECMSAKRKSSLCFLSLPFPHWRTQFKGKNFSANGNTIATLPFVRETTWHLTTRGISLDVGSAARQISLRLLLLSKLKEKNISGGLVLSSAVFGTLFHTSLMSCH